ncbi:MAG: HEPN domain-containing protein [Nitrospirae bacterium]|nr:MAG: HEPN domain-containing protein [Nitrospirota bacterium]
MSLEKDYLTATRWLNQAIDDFGSGEVLLQAQKFPQACFLFQQAAEKAIKAVWYFYSEEPWGHSVVRLIELIPEPWAREQFLPLMQEAKGLDEFYIPTRYPNGLPAPLIAKDVYTGDRARWAREACLKIINKTKEVIGGC